MMRIRTREATPGDAPAIAALLTSLGYPAEPDAIPRRLNAMAGSLSAVLLATDAEDAPLGVVAVHAVHAIHADAPAAIIMALVVAPEARGGGVGRTLVRAAESWAIDQGCERLMVTSAEHRADAHAFYPACGMPYTGRRFAITLSAARPASAATPER